MKKLEKYSSVGVYDGAFEAPNNSMMIPAGMPLS